MKFNKIYHALTADPQSKWAEAFREVVDIDPAQAQDENSRFDLTGVKYVAAETEAPEAEAPEAPEAEAPEAEAPEAEAPEAEAPEAPEAEAV